MASRYWPAWVLGTTGLSVAKILENMEIGHNVLHGQWDWMNDPAIHSSTWDWDTASPASAWKHSHNYVHHTFTNIVGKDKDVGYEIMRIDPKQKWHPVYLFQPFYNILLACFFEWGVAVHDLDFEAIRKGTKSKQQLRDELKAIGVKARRQIVKDYILFPALSGKHWRKTLYANLTANFVRNLWSYAIIFCGHFPDQAYTFTEEEVKDETRGGWYVRQLIGAANIEGSPSFHVMSGNLSFQVEHHVFPDMPSSRYQQIAPKGEEDLRALRPAVQHRPVPQAVGVGPADDPAARVPGRRTASEGPAVSPAARAARVGCLGQWKRACRPARFSVIRHVAPFGTPFARQVPGVPVSRDADRLHALERRAPAQ